MRHVVQLLTLGRRELGGHPGGSSEETDAVISRICTGSHDQPRSIDAKKRSSRFDRNRSLDMIEISKVASRIVDNYQFGAAAEVT